jgi:hypothetical protein
MTNVRAPPLRYNLSGFKGPNHRAEIGSKPVLSAAERLCDRDQRALTETGTELSPAMPFVAPGKQARSMLRHWEYRIGGIER